MVQWYPGHMTKARRKIKESLKQVDLVIEVLDARIPYSSKNPDLTELLNGQKHLIILNKIDLADRELTRKWLAYYSRKTAVKQINALQGTGIAELLAFLKKQYLSKNNHKVLQIMVTGITNTGKSTLINKLSGKKKARTGGKPGVTRGKQWVKLSDQIHLLDTPGILWPKFEEEVGYKLALTGAIAEKIFDAELVAYKLIEYLLELAPQVLARCYGLESYPSQPYDLMAEIARKRGCLMSGGRIDRERCASLIIRDFRDGKLGQVTLEAPQVI